MRDEGPAGRNGFCAWSGWFCFGSASGALKVCTGAGLQAKMQIARKLFSVCCGYLPDSGRGMLGRWDVVLRVAGIWGSSRRAIGAEWRLAGGGVRAGGHSTCRNEVISSSWLLET